MKKIIAQDRLINEINQYDVNTFPQSSMILGEPGSGKHLFVEYISNHLNVPLTEVNDKDYEEIYQITEPTIVFIDLDTIELSQQNKLLKIVEEPTASVFIILLSSSLDNVIDTLISRCRVFEIDRYDPEVLRQFLVGDNGIGLTIGNTPGDIIKLNNIDLDSLISKCYDIMTGIDLIMAVDIVSDLSTYELPIFLKTMLAIEFKDSGWRSADIMTRYMRTTADYIKLSKNKTFNKDNLLSSYLMDLVKINHEC